MILKHYVTKARTLKHSPYTCTGEISKGHLVQGPATHGITGATSGGSGAAKYNIISFFINFMTIKTFFLIFSGAACCRALT